MCPRCKGYVDAAVVKMSKIKFGVVVCDRCYVELSHQTVLVCERCAQPMPADDPQIETSIRHHSKRLCQNCYTKPDKLRKDQLSPWQLAAVQFARGEISEEVYFERLAKLSAAGQTL